VKREIAVLLPGWTMCGQTLDGSEWTTIVECKRSAEGRSTRDPHDAPLKRMHVASIINADRPQIIPRTLHSGFAKRHRNEACLNRFVKYTTC
jgi:hypothetical protein